MKDAIDIYIRQALKNWAARQHPASNGRARLLLMAALPASQQAKSPNKTNAVKYAHRPLNVSADQVVKQYYMSWMWVIHTTYAPFTRVT